MNVDEILDALNDQEVDYLLIGGMNFLLRHEPELTFDVDVWVRDDASNLERVNQALIKLGAEWGRTDADWKPVSHDWRWLETQSVFCVTTRCGALDVFRDVRGLEGRYAECRQRAVPSVTGAGVGFAALAEVDSLACHENEPMNWDELKREEERKRDAAYDPALRWQHIQQTITWAEANLPPEKRRNRPRVHPSCVPPPAAGPRSAEASNREQQSDAKSASTPSDEEKRC